MLGWFKRSADVEPAARPVPQESGGGGALADSESHVVTDHGAPDHPSVSMSVCEHGVATICPACIAIGAERKRIEAIPCPQWVETDEHVKRVIRWLREGPARGYILSSEIIEVYDELCDFDKIEPIPARDLLKALGGILKRKRLLTSESGGTRKRTFYFLPPDENG
ncbi:hypothetical protein ACO2I3_15705 [Leptospira interrogans]